MKDKLHFFIVVLLLLQIAWIRDHARVASDYSVSKDYIFGLYDLTDYGDWLIALILSLLVLLASSANFFVYKNQRKELKSSLAVIISLEVFVVSALALSRVT